MRLLYAVTSGPGLATIHLQVELGKGRARSIDHARSRKHVKPLFSQSQINDISEFSQAPRSSGQIGDQQEPCSGDHVHEALELQSALQLDRQTTVAMASRARQFAAESLKTRLKAGALLETNHDHQAAFSCDHQRLRDQGLRQPNRHKRGFRR